MSATFCTQQFPKLWSTFVDHFVDFGYTGECCATPLPQAESVPTTGKLALQAAKRLVAIGDLHGDLDKAKRAFQLAGLADARGNWVGGETVCVQVGDILDRGDDEIKIFYYLEKLQQQAKAAGGQLHVLNGNHETMTTAGYHRYATQGSAVQLLHWHWWQDVGAFLKQRCPSCAPDPTPSSSDPPTATAPSAPSRLASLAQHFRATTAVSSADAPSAAMATTATRGADSYSTSTSGGDSGGAGSGGSGGQVEFRGYLQQLQELHLSRRELQKSLRMNAFGPGQSLAKRFLAPHPTVLQVGSSVFVHGGILPQHVEYGLDRINRETSSWMQGSAPDGGPCPPEQLPHESMPGFLAGSSAIVWARDYSDTNEARCDCAKLQGVLGSIPGAARMVVGHTIQRGGINAACEEQVVRVDVGLSRGCGNGDVQVLEITGDSNMRRLQEAAPAKPQLVPPPNRPPPAITSPFWQQVAQAAAGAAQA